MSVLFVNTCVRSSSRTYRLARYFLDRFSDQNIGEIIPQKEGLYGLDEKMLKIRDQALAENDFSHPVLRYAVQFAKADTIVIAAPYWDLSFPAGLKNYIERINCVGVTFDYDAEGKAFGLCHAKRLIYISTSGGPVKNAAYGYGYLQALCTDFYGIPETVCFQAENLDMPFADPEEELTRTEKKMDKWLSSCL